MTVIAPILNLSIDIPSWYTGRLWLMRIGYYKLNRAKEVSNDWVWILDHSVQTGSEKCLLILGIRLKDLPKDRSLKYEDVEPIDLIPVTKSNGDIVYEQLENAVAKTGVPAEIIADHGSDIKSGVERFCEKHEETVSIYDIKHKTAAVLKRELEKDKDWLTYIASCSKMKIKVQQTDLASLAPPNQRSKARYMNVDTLIGWGVKILNFIDNEQKDSELQFDPEKFKDKVCWLTEYRQKIQEWSNLMAVIETTETFVRKQGLYRGANLALEEKLYQFILCEKSNRLKQEMLEFVQQESEKSKLNERLLGSSEIIESVFGKQKTLEQEQSKSGFTGLILGIPALVSTTTKDVIEKAMETVPTKIVLEWVRKNIGKSVQSKRKEVFSCT